MMTLTEAEEDALQSDGTKIGIFFRLGTDPVVRLWLGIGPCAVGISTHDPDGAVYSGLGQLIDVPAVQQLINGIAERINFHVSGVSADVLRLASTEATDVKGAACALGFTIFAADWSQLGVPKWVFTGTADYVSITQQPGDKTITRVIELSVGSLMTGRRRRAFSFLTNQDQKARHPGDLFCERTVLYSQDVEKRWPVPT